MHTSTLQMQYSACCLMAAGKSLGCSALVTQLTACLQWLDKKEVQMILLTHRALRAKGVERHAKPSRFPRTTIIDDVSEAIYCKGVLMTLGFSLLIHLLWFIHTADGGLA